MVQLEQSAVWMLWSHQLLHGHLPVGISGGAPRFTGGGGGILAPSAMGFGMTVCVDGKCCEQATRISSIVKGCPHHQEGVEVLRQWQWMGVCFRTSNGH